MPTTAVVPVDSSYLGQTVPEGWRLNEIRKVIKDLRSEIKAIPERMKLNDMNSLVSGLGDQFTGVYGSAGYSTQPRMQPYTLAGSSNFAQITLDRLMLTEAYTSQQLVALLIDLLPDTALSGKVSFEVDGDELDVDDLKKLQREMYAARKGIRGGTMNISPDAAAIPPVRITDSGPSFVECIKFARKMTRLYGGGALVVNTDQDYSTPFDIERLGKDSPLDFMPVDRWEIATMSTDLFGYETQPFSYYGVPIDNSRVCILRGKEPPSLVRQRLQGWGLSYLEPCIGAINAMLRFENLLFELLSQAKIDVYRIDGFTNLLGTAQGTIQAQMRIQLANALKSYSSAIIMDKNDEFDQKEMNFAGLAEIWNELRRNLASQFKIPMGKLFGESAGSMGSGEDSLQNFNESVEEERRDMEPAILLVAKILCKVLFGYVPETLRVKWPALRSLDGVQEEQVLTARQDRAVELFQMGLINPKECMTLLQAGGVMTLDTAALRGEVDIESPMMAQISMKEKGIASGGAKGRTGEGDKREKKRDVAKDGREAR